MNAAPSMPAPDQKHKPAEDAADSSEDVSGVKIERELGGPPGPEPTRYGDWERKGRCIDF